MRRINGIEGFRIIFCDIKLNAGGIKSKHGCKERVNHLADGFRIIHQSLEQECNGGRKTEFEAGKKRGIRDFGKAAEIPRLLTGVRKKDKKGIP